jgi:transposase
MGHYAGLDVAREETAVCVVGGTGRIVKGARVPSEPEAPAGFLLELGPVVARIGLEACSLAAWLHDGLAAAGRPVLCIATRQGGHGGHAAQDGPR